MKRLIARLFGRRRGNRSLELQNVRSILVKPIGNAVGDSIVHLRHIAQLKKAFPLVKIGVLVTERSRLIYENSNVVDVLIEDKVHNYFLQNSKWDVYLDFFPSFTTKSIMLDAILNPKYVINFGKRDKKYYNLSTVKNYDFFVDVPELLHFKDYLMYSPFSEYIDDSICYEIYIPSESENKVNHFWKRKENIKILLNPQGSTRTLPAEELSLLLENTEDKGLEFIVTNTNNSEKYFAHLPEMSNLSLSPKTTLFEYFALINSADIVISVDGGGVHVACACGKPLLAFYSNNQYTLSKWAPAPKENVSCLTLVGKNRSNDNNETAGFDMNEAKQWLYTQIHHLRK
ncbi:glycosyltransferase family 9 protein [Glaesserella sp.]|uniref:glycosyltransferase family 9 protein n=1 Tax=Glaesserella sp. TaxID=2094731 RepID=UPI0035A0E40B